MTKSTSTMEESKSEKKVPKTEKWEIDTIGEFLLELFHKQEFTIRDEFVVGKSRLRDRFQEYLQRSNNKHLKKKFEDNYGSSFNIGKILFHTDFLRNTPRGADYYRVKNDSLFQYRNEKLKEWDDRRRNGNHSVVSGSSAVQILSNIDTVPADDTVANFKIDPELVDYLKVADDAEYHPLNYEGSVNQCKNPDFVLSNMGCFICQRNFESADLFEKHIEWHGDDSDFESLKEFKKEKTPFFHLSYTICLGSHYFCFSLNTKERNVIIEKIIIVRSGSFYYINKNEYFLDLGASDKFFVDSHLFTNNVIQPIVIVFRTEAKRVVEQHHFWRTEEFPLINFSIKANRLPYRTTFKPQFKLIQYLPPNEIKLALRNDFASDSLYDISNELRQYVDNGKVLTMSNICNVLNTLVQIEDMDGIKKYATLVQHKAELRRFDNLYTVRLKNCGRNMVESILTPFDEVIVIVNTDQMRSTTCDTDVNLDMILRNEDDFKKIAKNRNVYFGVVEKVSFNSVTFSSQKKINENIVDKIIFRPARLTLRYQYRAIEYLDSMKPSEKLRVFFPISGGNENTENLKLELFNSSIAENYEQYQAVKNISAGPTKNATYIIFGPPGTGKTSTVVEAILQLYKRRPGTKILVTAGSNSACDEVAFRLCKVLTHSDDTRAIVRIFAKSNEKRLDNIDEMLIEASNMYGAHFYPNINVLHEYRIVVCTLSVVGKLSTGRFGRNPMGDGIYTHIFVDEVAASTEAETLVGISSTISSNSHVIISGDHKQLGPILQSDRARELGLNVSLMERLLKRDCYKVDERGNYDTSIQTRLICNYRSHPEIVKLYNELYYNGELIPMAKEDDVNLGKLWHSSPNPNFPIIFHNVFGNCFHDKSSTSLFNGKELEVVMDYVKDIMCYGINGKKIEQQDIGIISPYKKQYLRIQEELNLSNLYRIETGSVETFQGKEKDIIIVSFVRSFTSTIGFLNDPQRLNVTLSRAKSLLILVGNPKTLSLNDDFKSIIDKCRQNKTMVGTRIIEEIDGNADSKQSNNAKKLSRRQRSKINNNTNASSSNKKENIKDVKQTNVKQLGKQMKKGKNSQRQQNHETSLRNSSKKPLDIDLLLQSLPDVPNVSKAAGFAASTKNSNKETQSNENISYGLRRETVNQSFRDAHSNAKSPISVGEAKGMNPIKESYLNSRTEIPIRKPTAPGWTSSAKQYPVQENHFNEKVTIPIGRPTATDSSRILYPVQGNNFNVKAPIPIGRPTSTGSSIRQYPVQENHFDVKPQIPTERSTVTGWTTLSSKQNPPQQNPFNVKSPILTTASSSNRGVTATPTTTRHPSREPYANVNSMTDRLKRLNIEDERERERNMRESLIKIKAQRLAEEEARQRRMAEDERERNMRESLFKIKAQRLAEEEARQRRMAEEAKRNRKKKESSCLIS